MSRPLYFWRRTLRSTSRTGTTLLRSSRYIHDELDRAAPEGLPAGHADARCDAGRELGHRLDGQDGDGQGVLSTGDPEDTGRCYSLSHWSNVKRRLSKRPVSLDN